MTAETHLVCINHPKRETAVCCSKCGCPICTSCMIQTPVGMRCRQCAGLRKLPQHQVGSGLLLRSGAAGLTVSTATWLAVGVIPYLRFFLAIFVGFAVGEVMTRAARRRSNRVLEAVAVAAVIAGWVIAEAVYGSTNRALLSALISQPTVVVSALIPLAIASFVAVVKLR